MLAAYHQWVFEKHKQESVESLREWVIQEAKFQIKALETVHGLATTRQGTLEARRFKRENNQTYYINSGMRSDVTPEWQNQKCKVCSKSHGVWACPEFKQMEIQKGGDGLSNINCVSVV